MRKYIDNNLNIYETFNAYEDSFEVYNEKSKSLPVLKKVQKENKIKIEEEANFVNEAGELIEKIRFSSF